MPLDRIILSIVGVFAAFTTLFGIVRYFINLGNKLDTISGDIREFKLQQKKQWEKIDRTKDEVRLEREKRLQIERDILHHKEIIKEIKNTNRFKLVAAEGINGVEE